MVISFFDNYGVIFQHYLPVRTPVTAAVFKDAMNMFLKKFKEKRPEMANRDWYFHSNNALCHTANSTKEFLAKKGIKKMLEGVEIVDKSVQKEWTRVGRAIPEDRS
ncbi:Mariner Mos1 transposase, partial [Caligus rogercresseyi]